MNQDVIDLAKKVKEMRRYQKAFFAARGTPAAKDLLKTSKALEAEIDTELETILANAGIQKALF